MFFTFRASLRMYKEKFSSNYKAHSYIQQPNFSLLLQFWLYRYISETNTNLLFVLSIIDVNLLLDIFSLIQKTKLIFGWNKIKLFSWYIKENLFKRLRNGSIISDRSASNKRKLLLSEIIFFAQKLSLHSRTKLANCFLV